MIFRYDLKPYSSWVHARTDLPLAFLFEGPWRGFSLKSKVSTDFTLQKMHHDDGLVFSKGNDKYFLLLFSFLNISGNICHPIRLEGSRECNLIRLKITGTPQEANSKLYASEIKKLGNKFPPCWVINFGNLAARNHACLKF